MYFTKSKIATIIRFFLPLLLLTAAVSMTACAEQKHYKSTVEIITIDTKDGEDVRIPKFSTDHESEMKELMSLNDQVRDLENQYPAVVEAVRNQEIPMPQIDRSVRRVLQWKQSLNLI